MIEFPVDRENSFLQATVLGGKPGVVYWSMV
jgi:hypothetical protein